MGTDLFKNKHTSNIHKPHPHPYICCLETLPIRIGVFYTQNDSVNFNINLHVYVGGYVSVDVGHLKITCPHVYFFQSFHLVIYMQGSILLATATHILTLLKNCCC